MGLFSDAEGGSMWDFLDSIGDNFTPGQAPAEGFGPATSEEIDLKETVYMEEILPPDPFATDALMTDPNIPTCEFCGQPVEWKGRGRKPKAHKECREQAKRGGQPGGDVDGPAAPRVFTVRKSTTDKLTEDLLTGVGEASVGLMVFAPVTATTMAIRSEKGITALVTVAKDLSDRGHPGMLKGLIAAASVMPWSEVASYAGSIIYAAGVDMGRLPADGFIAQQLGVTAAAEQLGMFEPERDEAPNYVPNTSNGSLGPPPPGFTLPN